jgi:hypothetical protein
MQDPSVLALRRCNDCGSSECLVRTLEPTSADLDGTYFKEHRRVVNTLAEHCKAHGWSHPDVAAHHAAETARPTDVHATFPDQHLELAGFLRTMPPTGRAPNEGSR